MEDAAVVNSEIKCDFASLYYTKLLEEEYMIETCSKSPFHVKSFEERVKEKYLQSFLLTNVALLTTIDGCGKEVVSCDITKIHNLK